jgi:hypothetical protein
MSTVSSLQILTSPEALSLLAHHRRTGQLRTNDLWNTYIPHIYFDLAYPFRRPETPIGDAYAYIRCRDCAE